MRTLLLFLILGSFAQAQDLSDYILPSEDVAQTQDLGTIDTDEIMRAVNAHTEQISDIERRLQDLESKPKLSTRLPPIASSGGSSGRLSARVMTREFGAPIVSSGGGSTGSYRPVFVESAPIVSTPIVYTPRVEQRRQVVRVPVMRTITTTSNYQPITQTSCPGGVCALPTPGPVARLRSRFAR